MHIEGARWQALLLVRYGFAHNDDIAVNAKKWLPFDWWGKKHLMTMEDLEMETDLP